MTSIKIIIKEMFPNISSRDEGALLRNTILQHLESEGSVILDFTDAAITLSFADEGLGLLCQHLSMQAFKEQVKMVNLSPTNKSLIVRVIGNRFNAYNK